MRIDLAHKHFGRLSYLLRDFSRDPQKFGLGVALRVSGGFHVLGGPIRRNPLILKDLLNQK